MPYIVDLRKQKKTQPEEIKPPKKQKEVLGVLKKEPKLEPELIIPIVEKKPETPEVTPTRQSQLQWQAPSFRYNPQKRYIALVVIALVAGAGALLFYGQDMFLAIFLGLSALVLILYAVKKPNLLQIGVDQIGVLIDDKMYYYKELKSFWIDYTPDGPKELSLETKKWYLPYIKVSIENKDPLELRSLMIKFVPERVHEPSLIDFIARKIGI